MGTSLRSTSYFHSIIMTDHQPIGLFDSGVGGLSVWREIAAQLPHEDTLYFADQIHIPYGPRSLDQVARDRFRERSDLSERARPVWNVNLIGKIQGIFMGQLARNLTPHAQAADTGIENANGLTVAHDG